MAKLGNDFDVEKGQRRLPSFLFEYVEKKVMTVTETWNTV